MCVVLFADDYRLDEVLSDFLKQWWDKVHLNAELWSKILGLGSIYLKAIVIDDMCGDPILDLLFLAVPGALLGVGAFFMMGKDKRKKIEEIFR